MSRFTRRDALVMRGVMVAFGLTLAGIAFAGALHWITLGPSENAALGAAIFAFIVTGWTLGHWLRKHIEA